MRYLEIQNLLHPIFNSQPRDTIEMFYVARYKSQIFLKSCCSNERVNDRFSFPCAPIANEFHHIPSGY